MFAGSIKFALQLRIQLGFVVWSLGAAMCTIAGISYLGFTRKVFFGAPGIQGCAALCHLSLTDSRIDIRTSNPRDLALRLSFAATLPSLLRLGHHPPWFAAVAGWFSDFSNTLYLSRFPLAAFLWYTFLESRRLLTSPLAFGRFLALNAVLLAFSFAMFLVFERNTDGLRRWIMGRISRMFPEPAA